jgi:uncharacterized membrane protein
MTHARAQNINKLELSTMIWDEKELEERDRDPRKWKWGIFYYNPNDDRLIVPKRNPKRGATMNLANPRSYLIFVGPIFLIAILLLVYVIR